MNKQDFLTRFLLQLSLPPEESNLNTRKQGHDTSTLKEAAVLIPLIERNGELFMILTQRSLHLKHHPGQISFPGGKVELSDDCLAKTALRETEEEIGIESTKVEIKGCLTPLTTTSGYHVTPFIGIVNDTSTVQLDRNEVEKCFEVPCAYILNPRNFHKQHLIANRQRHYTYCCIYENNFIWGATAQMIINLQQQIQ